MSDACIASRCRTARRTSTSYAAGSRRVAISCLVIAAAVAGGTAGRSARIGSPAKRLPACFHRNWRYASVARSDFACRCSSAAQRWHRAIGLPAMF